jgi:putative glycosyltransferase (TIGR04372 family)
MLINKGLTVIRIGDKSMQPINLKDDKYVESYNSKYKSELIDLLLIQNCEFFIGMQSGPTEIALLFKKPVLEVNMYNWFFSTPMKPTDRGLLKKIIVPGIGEVNTLSKRFSDVPYKFTNMDLKLSDEDITFIENTPLEILEATKEYYLDYLSGFKRSPNEALVSNKKLHKLFEDEVIKLYMSSSITISKQNKKEVHRLAYRKLISLGAFYCSSSFKQ